MTSFTNPADDEVRGLLRRVKNVAVVGLSAKTWRPSHGVAASLQEFGYRVIPVNPDIGEALGQKSYPDLASIREPIDLVDVFRDSQHVGAIVDDCIRLKLPALWLQLGVIDGAAASRAQAAGVFVVMDRCIYREYLRLM